MKNLYDVTIVGGGMVGMSLAVALARDGISVAVIEHSSLPAQLEPAFDGRVCAIALGSKNMLAGIGVWQAMAPQTEPILDIRVSDGDTPFFLHYDHHEIGDQPFGYIIENRYIRNALHEAAVTLPALTVLDNTRVLNFTANEEQVTLELSNQSSLSCKLLIGADGKQSQIRKLAGIEAVEWSYNQTAIVCTIHHEHPHEGLAQERFLPAGPFAALPMTGNRSSLVWVEPNDRVQAYLELPDDDFNQEITERVGDYLGKIAVHGPRFSYPLTLMHAKTYVGKRLALMGDAAHGMHPIAGQGVNLGFRDVAVLHELITQATDIGSEEMLAHYQRWRRFDNTAMLAVTDMLTRLFSNNVIPLQLVRDMGLWAVSKMPPVKRFFMKHAMGLVGDVPKLIRKV